jgi:hypothetical protein
MEDTPRKRRKEMEDLDLSQAGAEAEETSDVLQQLEDYEDMIEQHGRYASLLEKAITHRQSVQNHIFEKVREEYEARKISLEKDREKLERLLRANLETFLQEREKIGLASREEGDRLEEINFRVLVGEYTEEGVEEEREALRQSLQQHAEELERTEEILSVYTRLGLAFPSAPSSDPTEGDPDGSDEASAAPALDEETLSSPSTPGLQVKTEQGAVGAFQVLEEEPELSNESCPVVQCLDRPLESSFDEGVTIGQDACGVTTVNDPGGVSGYLVAIEGSRRGERFPLLCSNITLGTSPGSDIRLSDPGIMNFHAQIHFKGRKHFLENLDNMGCSFVNGLQGGLMELKDGDIIRLGEIKFQVEYSDVN